MRYQLLFVLGFLCLVGAGGLFFYTSLTLAENYGKARAFTEEDQRIETDFKEQYQQEPQPETVDWAKKPEKGSKVAELILPSIDVSVPVYMGVTDTELSRGVGLHNTALPGTSGRIALAGHRETAFQNADQLQIGDIFKLETTKGTFTYRIRESRILDANDRSVVVETDKAEAALYTCWPLEFGATTEERLVFFADMIHSKK